MIVLMNHRDFQNVATLPFCYWCGNNFGPQDRGNRDHVPPENMFAIADKQPPLILKTHEGCNNKHSDIDEKIGQLVALQRGYVTPDPGNRKLRMEVYQGQEFGAVTNVNVIEAIWRYIRGFHAALYRQPLFLGKHTITTPFTPARIVNGELVLEGVNQGQHFSIVQSIKNQRAAGNVDRIISNNGKVNYECVWVYADDRKVVESGRRAITHRRACFFALDIYDWKTLGDVGGVPAHGCAGAYFTSDGQAPVGSSLFKECAPNADNRDPWDPFGP